MAKITKASAYIKQLIGLVQKGWCKGPLATDRRGKQVDPRSPRACKFCLAGADDASRILATYSAAFTAWDFIEQARKEHDIEVVTSSTSSTTKKQLLDCLGTARGLALKAERRATRKAVRA